MMKHRDVFCYLNEIAPLVSKESWDSVGLMVGSLEDETTGVITTLDLTEKSLDRAISEGANLIVTHHPVIFKPLYAIDRATKKGHLIARAMIHDITVFSWHTNYDRADGGVNDVLAKKLELCDIEVLGDGIGRIGTIVPMTAEKFADVVKRALNLSHVVLYGDAKSVIKRVAVVGGSGMDFAIDAREYGADALVTGDIRYHDAQFGMELGLVLFDATHDGTENPAMEALAKRLEERFSIAVSFDCEPFLRCVR